MNPLGFPLLLALTLHPPLAEAAPPDPRPRDLELAVQARRVLNDDPELGPLNLGVRVRDGVATLWGPVRNDEQRRRAVRLVRQVTGIRDARSDLYLSRAEPGPTGPVPVEGPAWWSAAAPDPLLGLTVPLVSRAKPLAPPGAGGVVVALHAPVPLGADVSASAKAAGAAEPLAERVEQVRARDPRYRGVRVEVHETTLILRGRVDRGQNVMAFAQALSRLEGVERVVVRDEPVPR